MAQGNQYLTLGIDREVLAVPVAVVQEILDMRECAKLPQAPPFLMGMIDVRGCGIPVIDLSVKLGLPRIETTPRTRIVVLDVVVAGRAMALGLVADCVFEVTDLDGDDLQQPPPAFGERWRSDCIAGIGRKAGGFVVVLDLDSLLSEDARVLAGGARSAIAA